MNNLKKIRTSKQKREALILKLDSVDLKSTH